MRVLKTKKHLRLIDTIDFDFKYLHHIRQIGKDLVDLDFLTFEFGC